MGDCEYTLLGDAMPQVVAAPQTRASLSQVDFDHLLGLDSSSGPLCARQQFKLMDYPGYSNINISVLHSLLTVGNLKANTRRKHAREEKAEMKATITS